MWSILVIGCVLCSLVWHGATRQEQERIHAGFQNRAQAQASLARERLRLYEEMVFSLRDSFLGQSEVNRQEFATVSRELLRRHSGVFALEWLRVVPAAEREAVEREATRELGFPFEFKQRNAAGQLVPAAPADEYTVILFVEPLADNQSVLGYDVTTAPSAEFIAAARRERKFVATRSFQLSQASAPGDEPGILFILPVYTGPEQDRLLGFVESVFRVQTMLSQAHVIGNNEALHSYYLDLEETNAAPQLLYANLAGEEPLRLGRSVTLPPTDQAGDFHDLIRIGGRRWLLVTQPNPEWVSAQRSAVPKLLLVGGLALTGLLALFVNNLLQRTDRVAREVDLRTRELRDSETRLQAILDHNPNVVWVKNLEGRYVLVNRQYERFWQRSAAATLGRTDEELFTPEIAAGYRRTDEQIKQTGEALRFELTVEQPGLGGPLTGLVQKFPLRDANGEIYGICGISTDITDRKLAEQEKLLIERKLLAAQKLESLGVLAGGIAHDFNNILTSVLANASFANLSLGPANPAEHNLRQIEQAARRAADLCQQMLAYAGKGKLTTDGVDLSDLVRGTASLLEVTINKNTRLDLRLEEKLPAVLGDPTQLRQIVMNLVINAADAIGPEPGVVTIATFRRFASAEMLHEALGHPTLPAGHYVGLSVTDNGCGMSPATLARIFEPFFTTKFSGRGLGLSAVLGIVQSHQGALFVESSPGHGSTFRLLLPATSVAAATAAPTNRDHVNRALTLRGNVLVIDDEPAVRFAASEVLRIHGAGTLLAPSGEEGVRLAQTRGSEINLVLLDMTMPGLGGEGTLQQLRAHGITCPVVIMSGYSEIETMQRTASYNVAGFLQKPFEIEELVQRLKPYLS